MNINHHCKWQASKCILLDDPYQWKLKFENLSHRKYLLFNFSGLNDKIMLIIPKLKFIHSSSH